MTRAHGWVKVAAVAAVGFLLLGACGGDDESSPDTTEAGAGGIETELDAILVPDDHPTIQAAVDAAEPGDLILVGEGTYKEAVDVTTPDITIRGVDRNKVILDGGFELENGIRVLDTDGVVIENMTAHSYVSNGFFWTGSDRYRGSYLTAYRNGDYGIYAFDAYHGQLDHSYGGGSPDAGFYIGECYPCDAVIDTVVSENNGLGYSGTNSGGDLYIVNSTFRNNWAGVVPNSGAYELCYPSRETTIVGNVVHGNNRTTGPAISVALLIPGNGIVMAGAVKTRVERNLVYDHTRWGILGVPYPEEDANAVPPPVEDDDVPCEETRDAEPAPEGEIPDLVVWHPRDNRVVGNVVSDSGTADLAVGTLPDDQFTTETLGNCFSENEVTKTEPTELQYLAPCDLDAPEGDWTVGEANLLVLISEAPGEQPKDAYQSSPVPEDQDTMPEPLTTPYEKFTAPEKPDIDAIEVPEKPA